MIKLQECLNSRDLNPQTEVNQAPDSEQSMTNRMINRLSNLSMIFQSKFQLIILNILADHWISSKLPKKIIATNLVKIKNPRKIKEKK